MRARQEEPAARYSPQHPAHYSAASGGISRCVRRACACDPLPPPEQRHTPAWTAARAHHHHPISIADVLGLAISLLAVFKASEQTMGR